MTREEIWFKSRFCLVILSNFMNIFWLPYPFKLNRFCFIIFSLLLIKATIHLLYNSLSTSSPPPILS